MSQQRPPMRETSLDELLADPLVQLLMRRDGVDLAELERIIARIAGLDREPDRRSVA